MLAALIHASEVITGVGVEKKKGRFITEADLGSIPDGAIVYRVKKVKSGKKELLVPTKIEWVGKTSELPQKYKKIRAKNLKNQHAVMPGLIDCHTHLIFAGDRAGEFAERCGGKSYQAIADEGGGIISTVRATRLASRAELEKLACERVIKSAALGVRTFEIKSGYGLSLESEIKCLEVIRALQIKFPQYTFVSTFMGAHAFPPEKSAEKLRAEYIDEICTKMIPLIAQKHLATFCDIFIDEGYFTINDAKKIFSAAQKAGLMLKVHADELACTEATSFAVSAKAHSADHLLQISKQGIAALAKSETVAVLLPGTAFYLKAPYAPARTLLDQGACVAIATDFNPGSCMSLSMPLMLTLSALYLKMTKAELFAAVTYNAAKALNLDNRKGVLARGMDADFFVLPHARFEEFYYRFGWS